MLSRGTWRKEAFVALRKQSGLTARRSGWLRRPATMLCGLAFAGAGVLVAPAAMGAGQASAATPASSATGNPLGSLEATLATVESELAVVPDELQTAIPATAQALTCLGAAVESLLEGGPPPIDEGCAGL